MSVIKDLFSVFPALLMTSLALFSQGETEIMPSDAISLPETIDGWKREGPPRRIDKTNIFDYMDGAGELYLGYHFDHLLVYKYKDRGGDDLLVEIYFMNGSQDAFGLLSLDWGGEDVAINHPGGDRPEGPIIPSSRALYGQGLLRAWSDNVYVRILAARESPGIKEVILRLGKMIAARRNSPPPPGFLQAIQPSMDSAWTIRRDRTAYFYSHLVLNSLYYLSHENILNLGLSTEAVIVTLEKEQQGEAKHSVRLLAIRYPDHEHASTALTRFSNAYLPDKNRGEQPKSVGENQGFFHIEDGWLGFRLAGRNLALVFECPDPESTREILSWAILE